MDDAFGDSYSRKYSTWILDFSEKLSNFVAKVITTLF